MKNLSFILLVVVIIFNADGQGITKQKKNLNQAVIHIDDRIDNSSSIVNSQQVYTSCEIFPQFKGGRDKFNQFISDNMIYPKEMKDKKLQGRVMVQFIVEPDGLLSYIRLAKPFGHGADEEALRLIELSHKWLPGRMNDKPVRALIVIPINFKLSE